MKNVYVYPALGRAGLGNELLTWARAEVLRHTHGLPMLAPQWTQFKIGPLLRGERDLRYYTGLFRQEGYLRGLNRLWLLRTAKRVPEAEAERLLNGAPPGRSHLIEVAGLGDFFSPLLAHRAYLKDRLEQIITPQVRAEIDSEPLDFEIAVHIRRGDKPTMEMGTAINREQWHNALPMGWFTRAIEELRDALGSEAKVCIFSDGRDDQLTECLALPGVRRARPKSAIADIIAMSRGKLMITTGTSTFSHWSAFLGGMPSLWYPSLVQPLSPAENPRELETDLMGNLSDANKQRIRALVDA